ncbi:DUF4097 domain-containing protein [Metabacillus fastidiosus]|uniref:DUF4097 domain-containing protein n=1 Tax=Metabacillus fastidiosus TaxID=1458 RepID=A0ABU6P129_9BACI|nr:DUF4097 domain-containing protein [Metabacillus fastidiosus]
MVEERKRILKLVEEGKLSASEALTLIEVLEEEKKASEQKITALSEDVIFTDKHAENVKNDKPSLGAKLMDFVDQAVKKVKEVDLDLNFGKSFDVRHIFQFSQASFQEIELEMVSGSINIKPWSDQDVRVECDAKVYRAEDQDSARDSFLNGVECEVSGNKFRFYTNKKSIKVNLLIYVPEREYDQMKAKLFNGPIRGEQLHISNLKTKTANGVISFSSIKGDQAEFETANGQIKLAATQYKKVEAETVNGLIHYEGTAEKLDIQSFNGNLIANVADENCHTLYAKTTTGNIDIYTTNKNNIIGEFKSNLGSLSADVPGAEIIFEKNETMQKELKFRVNESSTKQLTVFADSKTGSIHLSQS